MSAKRARARRKYNARFECLRLAVTRAKRERNPRALLWARMRYQYEIQYIRGSVFPRDLILSRFKTMGKPGMFG